MDGPYDRNPRGIFHSRILTFSSAQICLIGCRMFLLKGIFFVTRQSWTVGSSGESVIQQENKVSGETEFSWGFSLNSTEKIEFRARLNFHGGSIPIFRTPVSE